MIYRVSGKQSEQAQPLSSSQKAGIFATATICTSAIIASWMKLPPLQAALASIGIAGGALACLDSLLKPRHEAALAHRQIAPENNQKPVVVVQQTIHPQPVTAVAIYSDPLPPRGYVPSYPMRETPVFHRPHSCCEKSSAHLHDGPRVRVGGGHVTAPGSMPTFSDMNVHVPVESQASSEDSFASSVVSNIITEMMSGGGSSSAGISGISHGVRVPVGTRN